jgi:hypothetical protein
VDRGGGLIYDPDLNITWLADANYAKTSRYSADGRMNWHQAMNWTRVLVYRGISGWRLPTSVNHDGTPPSYGNWRSGSEMGHLFYTELGPTSQAGYPKPLVTSTSPALALFTNIPLSIPNNIQGRPGDVGLGLDDVGYWTGSDETATPYYAGPPGAWAFRIGGPTPGHQGMYPKEWLFFVWPVHDGDVGKQRSKPDHRRPSRAHSPG